MTMSDRRQSWLARNWGLLWGLGCFLNAILQARRWFEFHNQDAAIEALFNLFVGLAFLIMQRNRLADEDAREAMRKVNEEHPFPWEKDVKASENHG